MLLLYKNTCRILLGDGLHETLGVPRPKAASFKVVVPTRLNTKTTDKEGGSEGGGHRKYRREIRPCTFVKKIK